MADDLLLQAAESGDLEEAGALLGRQRTKADIAVPPMMTTPLHAACRSGGLDMALLLIAARARPDAREANACGGRAPMHLAAAREFGGPALISALLDAHASPVVQDARGQTPLHAAAHAGQADATRLLLAHGADPLQRDASGFAPSFWAKELRHAEVLQIYEDAGAGAEAPIGKITAAMVVRHAGPRARSIMNPRAGKGKKAKSKRQTSAPARGRK